MSTPSLFRTGSARVGLVFAAQLLTACQGVLDVSLPGNVSADALDAPSLAPTLVDGTQADFECAFTQYVESTALWSNEVLNSSGGAEVVGWSARFTFPEAGNSTCPTLTSNRGQFTPYLPLQIARSQAEFALKKLNAFTDVQVTGRSLLIARAALYAGFSYVMLSEGYCQVAVDDGPLLTPAQGLALAEKQFTDAIAAAKAAGTTGGAVMNAALVGRARVRIALGNKAGADADASLVPAGFVYNATYAAAPVRRRNTTMEDINLKFHLSVAPAYRELTVGGVADPRVIAIDAKRVGIDAVTPEWIQGKYAGPETPLPLATWDEAQLIMAEAEGGQSAVDAINRIRTKYNLPQYVGGTAGEIMTQIIEERRRTLWLDGHQISDHLRFKIPFATGVDQKGVRYNTETCIPLPLSEVTGRS
ncbi:MAG: RagB/SusD family nutrient uptake outer membrane protein [bacterium]